MAPHTYAIAAHCSDGELWPDLFGAEPEPTCPQAVAAVLISRILRGLAQCPAAVKSLLDPEVCISAILRQHRAGALTGSASVKFRGVVVVVILLTIHLAGLTCRPSSRSPSRPTPRSKASNLLSWSPLLYRLRSASTYPPLKLRHSPHHNHIFKYDIPVVTVP
jgi:hypothetical protein